MDAGHPTAGIFNYIRRTATLSFSVKAGGLLLGFLMQLFLAKVLDQSAFGTYLFLISASAFVITFSVMGLDKAALKTIPEAETRSDGTTIAAYRRFSLRVTAITAVVAAAVMGFVFHFFYAARMALLTTDTLLLFGAICISGTIAQLFTGYLQAAKKPILGQVPQEVMKPLLIIVAVAALWFAMRRIDLPQLLAINALVGVVICAALARNSRLRHAGAQAGATPAPADISHWLKIGLGFQGVTLCNVLLTQTDVMVIASVLGEESVALYGVALKVANLLTFFLNSANMIVAPLITRYHAEGKREELQRMMRFVAQLVTLVTCASAIVLVAIAKPLLGLFGQEYIQANYILYIICFGHCVNAMTGAASYLMSLTGLQRQALTILAAAVALNVVLNIVLVNTSGLLGAAIATATVTILWNIAMVVVVFRKTGINTAFL